MNPNAADGVGAFLNIVEKGPSGIIESAADVATGGLTGLMRASGVTMSDVGDMFKPTEPSESSGTEATDS